MLKYVIIGAGGTGGIIGAYMTKAGKDVTIIARGNHLSAMRKGGLTIEKLWDNGKENIKVNVCDTENYDGKADVVFVCVKSYSVDEIIPFIKKISHKDTVVIPILNVYGTGAVMQKKLPDLLVTDGCIYVSANIKTPGVILQHGKICKVLFGTRDHLNENRLLETIAEDLRDSGIEGVLSDNIQKDALQKFSYVSPMGAAGMYFDATAGDFQHEGPEREMFKGLVKEVENLAEAMGIIYEEDLAEVNLKILEGLAPEATTSMQRDIYQGKASEADGLIFQMVHMGKEYGVKMPNYEKAAEKIAAILNQQ